MICSFLGLKMVEGGLCTVRKTCARAREWSRIEEKRKPWVRMLQGVLLGRLLG